MIIFMGVAGAGKSVQGTLLSKTLDYEWLSTGEYLRANITGERKAEMLAGKLLEDSEIINILDSFFENIKDDNKAILDGFPRTLTQAQWLMQQVKIGRLHVSDVIYLNASFDVVKERLISRGRADDTEEALQKRFEEYERLTLPIIDWLKTQGVKVHEINAERSVEEIQADILNRLKS